MRQFQNNDRINGLLADAKKLKKEFDAVKHINPLEEWENCGLLFVDAATHAEALAIKSRSFVYENTSIKKAEYLSKAAEIHGIKISKEDDVYTVTLPKLLPGKKQKQNKFLLEPLYAALNDYFENNNIEKYFKDCLIYISFIYSKDTPPSRMLDYDNIETKQVIDAITTFFVLDDSGKYVDIYYTSCYGEEDRTEVKLMPKNHFAYWLKEQNYGN